MKIVSTYPDNMFSWVDLATPDTEAAKAFYGGLFGWSAVDLPLGDGNNYTMFQLDGHNVAGMGKLSEEQQAQGVPTSWSSYVNHSDVDAVAEKVAEAGGNTMVGPMDVFESGRMAFFQDPAGGVFGVWQPKEHIGAEVVNQPNSLVWNELQTKDAETARRFYSAVFGWNHSVDDSGYGLFTLGERAQAGLIDMSQEEGWNYPNFWMPYFMVEDIESSTEKINSLGGTVHMANISAGEMGKFSVAADPQGGMFTVMQFNGPADPPPGY